jgi:hypothetical protein
MNRGSLFLVDRRPDELFERQWRQQLAAWRQLLAQCGKKPSRKRIHGLRVATLRLQALLCFWMGTHENDPAVHAVKRWNKQAATLRKLLQPVRTAEVRLSKLAEFRKQIVVGSGPAPGPDFVRQISKLERGFTRHHDIVEKELVEEIGDRRKRLERWGKEIADTIDTPATLGGVSGAEVVREGIVNLEGEFPVLSADCLHAYRKRIKSLRYLAEFFAVGDLQAAEQARVLGEMQTVIGEWRDWDSLAKKARRMLKDEERALPDMLAALAARARRRALWICRRSQERLLHPSAAEPRQRKKPVRSARTEVGWYAQQLA